RLRYRVRVQLVARRRVRAGPPPDHRDPAEAGGPMTLYHVYIDRETRQPSRNVKAGSPEEAGHIAADLPSQDASVSEDRDGETFGARVDVAGDDAFARSVMLRGRAVAERS